MTDADAVLLILCAVMAAILEPGITAWLRILFVLLGRK
jgi:hypothetical protein